MDVISDPEIDLKTLVLREEDSLLNTHSYTHAQNIPVSCVPPLYMCVGLCVCDIGCWHLLFNVRQYVCVIHFCEVMMSLQVM